MSTTTESKHTLADVNVGDWVWIDYQAWSCDAPRSRLTQIEHVDKNGRLYISAASLWGQWRYGFSPKTGKAAHYRHDTMRFATEQEVAAELTRMEKQIADKQKREDEANRLELIRAAAPAMLEALEQCALACRYPHRVPDMRSVVHAAEAAIRLAKGESQ